LSLTRLFFFAASSTIACSVIGIHDVEFVRAGGLNLGAEQRERALAQAHTKIAGGMAIAA